MFLGKNLEVKNDTFFIEIKGPYNVVKIIARSLDTPGSSLEKSII